MVWRFFRGLFRVWLNPAAKVLCRREPRIAPPLEMIHDMGLNAQDMVYSYSGHLVNWGGVSIHLPGKYLFSVRWFFLWCGENI